jgi:hypothetical protein
LAGNFDDLMEFPSIYTFKIIGKDTDIFRKDVNSLKTDDRNWEQSERKSRNSKYVSFSLTTVVENSDELKLFYESISKVRDIHFYV